jgi:hypothetical protein
MEHRANSTEANRWGLALWVIVILALLVRIWGIEYGLPFVYWTDEYHEVMRAMELGAGGFNWARTGKGGFYLLLFVEYGLYFAFLKVTGVVSTTQEFAELFARDPTVFYLLGRATTAVFGAATVAVAFVLGRTAYRHGAGLLAALFVAVNVLHADLSHRVGVDIPMTLFAVLALCFAVRIASGGSRRDYVLGAVSAALATTTKLPGILVLLPLIAAHAYGVSRQSPEFRRWLTAPNLWLAAGLFIAVWVATNPGIVVANNYWSLYAQPASEVAEEVAELSARPVLWIFYLDVLKSSMGWPLFSVALVSAGYAAWRRRPADVLLLAYALVNYVAISVTTAEYLYFPRYALPIIVVLSVLAARAVYDLLDLIPSHRRLSTVAIAVVLAIWPLGHAVSNSRSLTRTDTRTLARQWFDAKVPAGSVVLVEGGKISASRLSVPITDSEASLQRRIEYWRGVEPRQAKFLEIRRDVHDGGGYELELVRISTIGNLEEYLGRGVQYFVVRPESFEGSRKADGGSARLLAALRSDPRVELARRFDPADGARPGPAIEVYKMRQHSRAGSPP